MSSELPGRHALVTGGSGGIGAAIASTLASRGAAVTLVGRDRTRLDAAARSISAANVIAAVTAITADVADERSVAEAFARARAQTGPIDILVNAAGAAAGARATDVTLQAWSDTLGANLTGVFLCCREALAPMLDAGFGRIVNVASTAGLRGYRYVSAYCAAKHGVVGLTRALALESAARGVTVNAVCPGYTETAMLEDTVANIKAKTGRSAEEARAALLRDTPRGVFTRPEEVAAAVVWLCSTAAAAVTGQAIAIDGGELAG